MKKITCLLILTSFLFACSPNEVDHNLVQDRSGLAYLPNESEPFTGKAVSSYPSGQQKKVSFYEKGKPTGISYEWHANGQLKTEQHFSGEDEGRIRNWYENGEVARDIRVLDGTLVGKNVWKSSDFKGEINSLNAFMDGISIYNFKDSVYSRNYDKGQLLSYIYTSKTEDSNYSNEKIFEHNQDGTKARLAYQALKSEYKSVNYHSVTEKKLENAEAKIITKRVSQWKDEEPKTEITKETNKWFDASPVKIHVDTGNDRVILENSEILEAFSLETGLLDGAYWDSSESYVTTYPYNQGIINGYQHRFDRTTATWEEDPGCFILDDYESEKEICKAAFGEPKPPYKNIPTNIKSLIDQDIEKVAKEKEEERKRKAEAERKKKAEEERKKKAEEERKRQQAEEKRKLEAEKRKLEAEKRKKLEAEKKKLVTAELEKIKNSGNKIHFSNSSFTTESDFIPVYVRRAEYPRRAQTRGKEGYAIVEVIITTTGGVRDPVLIEEWPEGWGFGRSALKAANELKYNPRVVDGVPQEVTGVLYKFSFQMAQ
jgi:TonB family protein